jgi:hypothetical protein
MLEITQVLVDILLAMMTVLPILVVDMIQFDTSTHCLCMSVTRLGCMMIMKGTTLVGLDIIQWIAATNQSMHILAELISTEIYV